MSTLNDVLFRDERIAKSEAERGMHHCFYLFIVVKRLIEKVGLNYIGAHDYDPITTGAHWQNIVDPVTGIEYEIRITPKQKRTIPIANISNIVGTA